MSLGRVLTFLALMFGSLAALLCLLVAFSFLSISLLKLSMFCAIAGIICSVFVIFRRTQYMLETKWNHPVVVSLFLSSIPIIYLISIIFIFKN